MNNYVAIADRAKPRRKSSLLILPFKPRKDGFYDIDGGNIRKLRIRAGYSSQESFAMVCGWKQTKQSNYEQPGENRINPKHANKMISVFNGGI